MSGVSGVSGIVQGVVASCCFIRELLITQTFSHNTEVYIRMRVAFVLFVGVVFVLYSCVMVQVWLLV